MPPRSFLPCCFAVLGSWASSTEAQTPKDAGDSKARAIQYRLLQPISLNFKDVPLQQAVKQITIQSGVSVTLDVPNLRRVGINLDAPISFAADKISMKSALNLMLLTTALESKPAP